MTIKDFNLNLTNKIIARLKFQKHVCFKLSKTV